MFEGSLRWLGYEFDDDGLSVGASSYTSDDVLQLADQLSPDELERDSKSCPGATIGSRVELLRANRERPGAFMALASRVIFEIANLGYLDLD